MALYEHIYLARQDISAQQVEALTAQFKAVIESFGGKVEKVEYWGVKSLAYRIKKNRKAHFSFLNIDAPPAALTEMERQMGINEDIIRFMTIRVEALEQGQSVMMRKREMCIRDRACGARRRLSSEACLLVSHSVVARPPWTSITALGAWAAAAVTPIRAIATVVIVALAHHHRLALL